MSKQPNFKPVYILGAGASKMVGGPLLDDFMTKARAIRYSPSFSTDHGDILNGKLSGVFDTVFNYQGELNVTKAVLGSDLDNIENLFSMLDMDYQTAKADTDTKKIEHLKFVRECFFSLVIETLRKSIHVTSRYQDLIKQLAVSSESTFITFNYDLAIEKALTTASVKPSNWTFSIDYGLGNETNNHMSRKVLKLHGSANWVLCEKCGAFKVFDDYTMPLYYVGRRGQIHDEMVCGANDSFLSGLIPPTWNKSNYFQQLTSIWNNSIQQISLATHLFIIGYSFPETDTFFNHLLGLAFRSSKNLQSVFVVNPNIEIEKKLGAFFERHFLEKKILFMRTAFENLSSHLMNPEYYYDETNFKSRVKSLVEQPFVS